MDTSGWGLKLKDGAEGAIIAVGATLLTYAQQQVPNYHLPIYVQVGISGLITYLLKKYFTDDVKQAQKTLNKALLKNAKLLNDATTNQ